MARTAAPGPRQHQAGQQATPPRRTVSCSCTMRRSLMPEYQQLPSAQEDCNLFAPRQLRPPAAPPPFKNTVTRSPAPAPKARSGFAPSPGRPQWSIRTFAGWARLRVCAHASGAHSCLNSSSSALCPPQDSNLFAPRQLQARQQPSPPRKKGSYSFARQHQKTAVGIRPSPGRPPQCSIRTFAGWARLRFASLPPLAPNLLEKNGLWRKRCRRKRCRRSRRGTP